VGERGPWRRCGLPTGDLGRVYRGRREAVLERRTPCPQSPHRGGPQVRLKLRWSREQLGANVKPKGDHCDRSKGDHLGEKEKSAVGGRGIRTPGSVAASAVFKSEVQSSRAPASVRFDRKFSGRRPPTTAEEHSCTLGLPSRLPSTPGGGRCRSGPQELRAPVSHPERPADETGDRTESVLRSSLRSILSWQEL
jgi:hypothetical protein